MLWPRSLLLGSLLAAPASASASAPTAAAVDDDPVARVEQAIAAANDDPTAGAEALTEALAELQADRERLAQDPNAREIRARAQLTLARARLANADPEGANAALDDAIRTYGTGLEVQRYGPTLSDLFQSRAEALADAGKGTIDVRCAQPCRVLVNELPAQGPTAEVFVGHYRVHVEGLETNAPPSLDLSLDVTGTTVLHWPEPAPAGADASHAPDDPPAPGSARRDRDRVLPRWAEVVILTAGAAAVGAGAAMLAIDGRCPGGEDPMDADACPQVYTTKTPGIGVLAAGAAVLVTGGVLLTVDEVRIGRARGRSVSVGLHLKF